MDDFPYVCGTCGFFGRAIRESEKTGAALDARTCTHPNFGERMGKCPKADSTGCLYHTNLVKHLETLRTQVALPNLGFFDDRLRSAGVLQSFSYGLECYATEFFKHFREGTTQYVPVSHGSKGEFLYCLGHALMQTDPDTVRVEFFNVLNEALEAYLQPAFQESYTNIFIHLDDVLKEIENRYTPLQEEVEALRAEMEVLKHEDPDIIGPPPGVTVED